MKKIKVLLPMIMLSLVISCSAVYADTYLVKGKNIDGRIYLPITKFRELGLVVTWRGAEEGVGIETPEESMIISKSTGLMIIKGKSYAQVRHLNLLKGVDVHYDPNKKGAIVQTNFGTGSPSVEKIGSDGLFEPDKRADSYRDLVREGKVFFSYKNIQKYGMEAYSDYQLARIRIKADYQPLAGRGRDIVTVDEVVETFSKMLKLTPEQLERVGILDGLMDSRGRIDESRTVSWAELNQVICSYFEYMGIDPFDMPAHESAYLKVSNERRLSNAEAYNVSALKWVGIDAMGEIDYRRGEISIYRGDVDVAGFNALLRQLTMY